MAKKSSINGFLGKFNRANAPYLFVGGVVILSIATLVMVISQPETMRPVAKSSARTLYLRAAAQKLSKGSIVEVTVMADSGEAKISAVQAKIAYPADKLLFFGIRQSATFPVEAATNTATPGVILLGRGTALGSPGVVGQNEVVTVSFQVLTDDASMALLKLDPGFSMMVQASDNANILDGTSGTYLQTNVVP